MDTRRTLDFDQYIDFSKKVQVENPDKVRILELSDTGRYPLISFNLTDPDFPSSQKQNVLFTAMHSGVEYSGANTLIIMIKRLLDGSDSSMNFLRNYNITVVPVVNPYSYEKGGLENQHRTEFSGDPYSDPWTVEGVFNPSLNTEAAAIQSLIDELKPELFIDCHGVFFKDQHMIENTGVSVHGMSRPHNELFPHLMNKAAKDLGYHCEHLELRQKSLPVIPELAGRKYQTCSRKINPCVYAYHNYHTLAMVMEIGFEESGVARLIKALELGLTRWEGEAYPGFPVNRVFGEGLEGLHPYSKDMNTRRNERVQLWNYIENYSYGVLYPQIPGRETYAIINKKTDIPFYENAPEGSFLTYNPGAYPKYPGIPFSISFKIPFSKATVVSVEVNGETVPPEGWNLVDDNGFTMVYVGFPSGIGSDTFITVKYDYSLK